MANFRFYCTFKSANKKQNILKDFTLILNA